MLAPLTTCLASNRRLSASGRFRCVDGAVGGAAAQHEQAVPKRVDDGLNVLASRLRAAREVDDQRSVDDARRRARKATARGDGHRRGAHGLGDARRHAVAHGRRRDRAETRRAPRPPRYPAGSTASCGTKGTGDFVPNCGDSPPRHHILGHNPPSLLSQSRYAVASGVKPTSLKHLEASEPLRNSRKSLAPSACGAFFIAAAG